MRPVAERDFLSCDWGTSHFRLKWVCGGEIVAQYQDENGCKKLHAASEAVPGTRANLFEKQLQKALDQLFISHERPSEPLPLVISGMASSSIGWMELAYSRLPLPLDGSGLKVELVSWNQPCWVQTTWLISGVATERDMMRGEETEMIGLLTTVEKPTELLLLLPGTHSKHLLVRSGVLHYIRTYMTGELYSVLSDHSVLAASVLLGGPFDRAGFLAGIDTAREDGCAAGLFQTRTRQVLGKRAPAENAAFLSGLLIGAELNDLLHSDRPEILVGGARRLRELYGQALDHLGCTTWRGFSDFECDHAVIRGQNAILATLPSSKP